VKVNIVVAWPELHEKRMRGVHRFVKYLTGIDGWGFSRKLDSTADVNYVFGHTDLWKHENDPWKKYREWDGPLACYFTHKEPHGIKCQLWGQAARAVDLRVAQSLKYAKQLERYGPTEQVAIPIERELFVIDSRKKKGRIGVSGYCARTGRKGSSLVYELANYPRMKWPIIATGRGWPVPTTEYRWKDLPKFYQKIDAYLCTSLYEGGPLGPLEALSCGTPVVIPIGVGAMDELPDIHGIYRYKRGNFGSMFRALTKCMKSTHNKEELRAVTREMTVKNFRDDHKRIFERHFA